MQHRIKNGDYFHVTFNNNKWHVKEVKNDQVKTYNTKNEAIAEAKEMVKKSTMGHIVIHNEKGKFQSIKDL